MAKSTKTTTAMTTAMTTTKEATPSVAVTSGLGTMNTMGDALSDEMNGLSVAFEQIRIPIGGMTFFEMPSDDPEKPETVKEFSAIILYHHPLRAYYKEPYTGGNNPPDCGSMDAMEGIGEPGGDCAHCVLNQFGSAENGAKACKERHRLYLLLEGEIFPMVLSLPTGSLKDFARYLMHCISKGYKGNTVVTRFSLVKATNKGGIVYTKVRFQMERRLKDEEIAKIEPLVASMKAVSQTFTLETATDQVRSEEKKRVKIYYYWWRVLGGIGLSPDSPISPVFSHRFKANFTGFFGLFLTVIYGELGENGEMNRI